MSAEIRQLREKKKKAGKNKLSAEQEKRLFQLAGLLLAATLLWIAFAPGKGLVSLYLQRNVTKELQSESLTLQKDNARIQEQIDKARQDPAYLEDVARNQYKMVKKNEYIFDFSKPEKKKD